MRVIRFLFLLLGVAMAAGCAREPVAYVAYSPAPTMSGIDNVVYGAPAPSAPAMMASGTYAMVPGSAASYPAPRYAAPAQYAAASPYAPPTSYAPPSYAAAPAAPALFGYAPQVAAPQGYVPQI